MSHDYKSPRRGSRGATRAAQLRIAAGMTQKELATRAGVSLAVIQGIEYADRQPRVDSLQLVASALGADNPLELLEPAEPIPVDTAEPSEADRIRAKGYRGIHWDRANRSWVVALRAGGASHRYGSSKNLDDAIQIWTAAKEKMKEQH